MELCHKTRTSCTIITMYSSAVEGTEVLQSQKFAMISVFLICN